VSKRESLDPEEQALWAKVVATVTPLHRRMPPVSAGGNPPKVAPDSKPTLSAKKQVTGRIQKDRPSKNTPTKPSPDNNLNSHWDRRFKKGAIVPDVSIDLHGIGLAGAYARLDGALEQAVHQHLRVILLVTGKARSHDRASGQGRGAIASVVRDWLAASRHASHISAVRNAHPRHGGSGALYIILKR